MIGVFIKLNNVSNTFSQDRMPPNQREVSDGKNHKIQAVEMKNINKFGNIYYCTDQRI